MDDEAAAAAYEETRLANMKANAALLDSLGLAKPAKAPTKRPSRKRQWSEEEDAAGPRRSLRATRGTRRNGEPRAESAAAKVTTTKASSSSLPLSSSSPPPEAPSYPDFSDDASSYEATRLANIRANAELLLSLGLTGFDDGSKASLEDKVAGKELSDDKYAPRNTLLAEKQRQTKAARKEAMTRPEEFRRSARFAAAKAASSSSSVSLSPYARARRASSAHSATPSLQSSGSSSSSSSSSMSPSPSFPLTPSPTKSKRAGHTVSAWTSPNASSWSARSLSPSRYSGRERRQANFWPSYVVPLGKEKGKGQERDMEMSVAVGGTDEGEVEDATASFVASCRIYDEQRRAKTPPASEEDAMWIEMDLPEAGDEWWREGRGEQSAWFGRRFLPRLAAK